MATVTIYTNGGNSNDIIDTSASLNAQQVQGRGGDDTLIGGALNDKLYGNEGNDVLIGGAGTDTLSGGIGADTYVMSKTDMATGSDSLLDFDGVGDGAIAGGDLLQFTGFSASAALIFIRHSGNNHVYEVRDGTFRAQFTVTYAGTGLLQKGDYVFVPPANRAPILSDAQAVLTQGSEDTAYLLSVASLLSGFSDADGDALSVSGLTADRGVVVDNGDGSYTITPEADYNGPVVLTYSVIDGRGGLVTTQQSFVIEAVNDVPVLSGAQPWLSNGTEDAAYTVAAASLLDGFTDADGDSLSVSGLSVDHGIVYDNGDGSYIVVPETDYNGAVTLSYEVSDGNGGSVFAQQFFTLDAVDDVPDFPPAFPPVEEPPANTAPVLTGAQASLRAGSEDVAYTVTAASLLDGFSDADGDGLSVSNLSADRGTVIDNGDGSYTITQDADYNGAVTLSYEVSDGNGGSVSAQQSFVIEAINDGPVLSGVQPKLGAATEDTAYTITAVNLLDGFTDIEGDALGVSGLAADHGVIADNGDGTYSFTPDANYNGPVALTYDVVDGNGGSVSAGHSFVIEAVNDGPVLSGPQAALANGSEDTAYTMTAASLLQGFSDADGDSLSVSDLAADHGVIADNGDGTYTFTPDANHYGLVAVTYNVIEGNGGSVAASGSFVLDDVYDAPPVTTVAAETSMNDILSGKLVAAGASGFSLTERPTNGTVRLSADGGYIYAPNVGFSGVDQFLVTIDDGHGGLSQQRIQVGVQSSTSDPTPYRNTGTGTDPIFIQRDGTVGSFYVAADAARVTKNGVVIAEATENGAILGVPQGDGYVLETVTAGKISMRPLAVGMVVTAAGQSNMAGWFTAPSNSVVAESGIYTWTHSSDFKSGAWVAAVGASALAFAQTLRANEPGLPIAFVDGSSGGTSLVQINTKPYWMATGEGSLYQNLVYQVQAASHGQSEVLIWNQGETDAAARTAPAVYGAALQSLFARFDTALGDPTILIAGLSTTGGNSSDLRLAQEKVAATTPDVFYSATSPLIETIDGTHLTTPGRILQGIEVAVLALKSSGAGIPTVSYRNGTIGNDTLSGGTGVDIIQADTGNDRADGGAGNDVLRGMTGDDSLYGNTGNDAVSGGAGNDTTDGGDGNDDVYGDAGLDVLYGGAGNDRLDGGAGADALFGGAGDDTYVVDDAGDTVSESAGGVDAGGDDLVEAYISYVLPSYVENMKIVAATSTIGTGNALDNGLTGNGVANVLYGLGGNDRLFGLEGNDTLFGGDGDDSLDGHSGNDVMNGGAGNDSYLVDSVSDIVSELTDALTDAGGRDSISSSVTITAPQFVENVLLTGKNTLNATGNGENNGLTGNLNNNVLLGLDGNDTLLGMAGNDALRGGNGNDNLQGGDGVDTLIGGLGADTMTGDLTTYRQDIFVFETIADSGVGSGLRDVILDYGSGDLLDLRLIDANAGVAGDQAFTFIGTGQFTAAGQVRYQVNGLSVIVELNVDGSLSADAQIELLQPLVGLSSGSFFL